VVKVSLKVSFGDQPPPLAAHFASKWPALTTHTLGLVHLGEAPLVPGHRIHLRSADSLRQERALQKSSMEKQKFTTAAVTRLCERFGPTSMSRAQRVPAR